MWLILPLAAFLLSAGLLKVLLHPRARAWFLDHPNARSLHSAPVPRSGGLALFCGATVAIASSGIGWPFVAATLALVAISLLDDWREVPALVRLFSHLAVAAGFLMATDLVSSWIAAGVLVVAIVWMANLYNFMDGADGLAGGMALIGFTVLGGAAWQHAETAVALAAFGIAAAALAFLLFNFPPARIFMGDAGSVPCGFSAAALGLLGWSRGAWPLWFPLVVFCPFVLDATVTLLRRLARGEQVWRPHRSHYYQRQVLMGWTHRQLAVAEYSLMAVSACIATIAAQVTPRQAIALLIPLGLGYLAIMVSIDVRWARRGPANA